MTTALACNRCGEPLAPGARYCTRCGNDVSGEQAALATVAMAAAAPPDPQAELLERLKRGTVGEFEIYGELGRGGMATVYLAHDIALGRKVAIKVMNPSLVGTGAGMVERFKREARTAAALSHPHIIPIYAVRETPFIFFVMKFVKGRSLDEIIKRTGPLPIPMFQTILHQAGGAIDYAHHQGTIHRDIKPANIMLDEDGWAVVTDFGIAKVADSQHLTMTGVTVGTPSYMSPEQCAAKEITAASDQYSLGIVAYEMLTGQVPFQADSVMGVMWQHFNDPPRPINELRPDCPPEIEAAVLRMLGKKAEDRFPSVEDAIDAIGAPTLRKDDPIRRQMKALAREGAGAEVLARVHTPASPLPTGGGSAATAPPVTPPSVTPPKVTPAPAARTAAPTTPVVPAPPRTPIPAPPVTEAPTVISDPRIAEAPTTITPAPVAHTAPPVTKAPPPVKAATPAPALEPARPARPPRPAEEPSTRRSPMPVIAGVAVLALAGAGAWYFLAGPGAGSREQGAGDSGAVPVPPPPAPVATVRVSPSPASTNVGGSLPLAAALADAQGNALTGRSVTWQASDTTVARVGSDGVLTARKAGTLTVTATSEGRSGTASVTVTETVTPVATVAVTPNPATLALGDSLALTAAPKDAGGTTLGGRPIQWSSSAPQVASVSDSGVLVARREGTATVTAVSEGRRANVRVSVTPPAVAAVDVAPAQVTLAPGARSQLTASARDRRGNPLAGRAATWTSSDEDVAAVSSSGRVMAAGPGRATITARVEGASGTATVIVAAPTSPLPVPITAIALSAPPTLTVGGSAQLQATARDAQGNALSGRAITWTSSNPAVVRVGTNGELTAVAPGTATITATAEGRAGTATVTIEAPRGAPPPVLPPTGGGTQPSTGAAAALPSRAIAAGGQHTCGITASGGVSCWGSNSDLQLGDAGTGQSQSQAAPLSTPVGVKELAAGGGHTCALLQNGGVTCWGQNRNGQLGGTGTQLVTLTGGRTYTALSAGLRHTCGIAADAQIWCWGDNASGQLGDGTTRGGATPRLVKGGLKFKAVAAGGDHTCAVTQAGKVHCWGDGFSGQLGRGIRETQSEPVEVSLPVAATAITAGAKHTCALGQNGTVYCWGENRHGEVGDGTKAERATPVAVAGRLQFVGVDAGNSHTCAVTAAGEAYCWGDNTDGRLGDGTRVPRTQPTKVSVAAVRSISAGGSHTCALTRAEEAVCWGGNARGQVGDGTTEIRAAPTPVTTR